MRTASLRRLTWGASSLMVVIGLSVLGFRFVAGYDWIDALWMVIVTISTVGYGEQSQMPVETQLLTIGVIVLGVSAAAYTFGGLVQYLLEGELDRALGNRKMGKEISRLSGHVVVCGYGRIGEDLMARLHSRGLQTVVVDNDPERTEMVRAQRQLAVTGDATSDTVLEAANIRQAKAIVTALPTDAQNVFIALTARNICPRIQIIATSEHASSCKKLRQAGADKVVMPHRVGARQMERMISRPSMADLFDVLEEASELEMEMDELQLGPQHAVVGKTIGTSGIRDEFDTLVIAIKFDDERLKFNPSPDQELRVGDTLLVIGPFSQIQRLKQHYV